MLKYITKYKLDDQDMRTNIHSIDTNICLDRGSNRTRVFLLHSQVLFNDLTYLNFAIRSSKLMG